MITFKNRKGELQEVVGDPVMIVSVKVEKMELWVFKDGEVDATYRQTDDLSELQRFMSQSLTEHQVPHRKGEESPKTLAP